MSTWRLYRLLRNTVFPMSLLLVSMGTKIGYCEASVTIDLAGTKSDRYQCAERSGKGEREWSSIRVSVSNGSGPNSRTEACISLGNYRGVSPGSSSAITIVGLRNVEGLVLNDAVEALVCRTVFQRRREARTSSRRVLVSGQSLELSLGDLQRHDSAVVKLSTICPDTVCAPGNFNTVQDAIDSTDIGDVALVDTDPGTYVGRIVLKNGVKIASTLGSQPTFIVQGDTGIVFPEEAVPFTSLDGVRVIPDTVSNSTEALILVRGGASVRNCTIQDAGGTPSYGIIAENHTGTIESCNVMITSGTQTAIGISLSGSTTKIANCTINTKNGSAQSEGIVSYPSGGVTIENCLVKSNWKGIVAATSSDTVAFCTVDSTSDNGIYVGGWCWNSIVTNVSGASNSGIAGNNAWYCIAPDGIDDPYYCSADDPLYCSSDEYTLRVDSYGNPENNPSGQVIGNFPVNCMYGTVQRDATWSDVSKPLPALGDVTIPSGRTLTFGKGVVVNFAKGDSQEDGVDSTKTEINVSGSLIIDGGVQKPLLTSAAAVDSVGDWHGIRILEGGSAQIDSTILEYATYGVRFSSGAMGTVSVSTFRHNQNLDIECEDVSDSPGILISGNNITASGLAGIGLYGNVGDYATVYGNSISGSGGTGGLWLQLNGEFQSPTIDNNTITGPSGSGSGVFIWGGTPLIKRNTIQGWLRGIDAIGPNPSNHPLVIGVPGFSNVDNVIKNNSIGVSCVGDTFNVMIRENKIINNDYGIGVASGASVDAGKNGQGNEGNNDLTGNSIYCIWNKNTPGPKAYAKYNWFGTAVCEGTAVCFNGNVDAGSPLCSAPASEANVKMGVLTDIPKGLNILGVSPNPLNSEGVIEFTWGGDQAEVGGHVFDVAGRVVADLGSIQVSTGRYRFHWNSRDLSGRRVSSGVYFIRLTAGQDWSRSVRVLVVR